MIRLLAPWGEIHPEEKYELGFVSTFGKRWEVMKLSVDTITLYNEDRENIFNWIYQTNSRFEAIPITVESDTGTGFYKLDLSTCRFTDSGVSVQIINHKGSQDFFQRADDLSFEAIEKFTNGGLSALGVKVPYLIVKPDIALQSLLISFSIFSVTMEIIRTAKYVADLAGQALDVVGTGVLTTAIQIISLAVYLIALVVTLIDFIKKLVQIFFPKLRYFRGMRDYDLLKRSIEYLGYTLDSTLMESIKNWFTLPKPITRNQNRKSFFEFLPDELSNEVFNYAYPTAQDTTPTLGMFISSIEQIFNAETIVYNGVVKIETRSWFQENPVASIEEYFSQQDIRETSFIFDVEEDFKRKTLGWLIDYQDLHTADNFYKTSNEQDVTIPNANPEYVKVKGYVDVPFQFSLAQRKNGLNFIEKLVEGLLKLADKAVALFESQSNFASIVSGRDGVLIISEEQFSITKKMYVNIQNNEARQTSNFMFFLGADTIFQVFHRDLNPDINSGRIVEDMPFPCDEYIFSLFSQNKFIILGGQTVELLSAKFDNEKSEAMVTYKVFDGSGLKAKTTQIY